MLFLTIINLVNSVSLLHCSFDVRQGEAIHWKSAIHLKNRVKFSPENGTLTIKNTSFEDTDIYTCRVDFKNHPTISYTINLTVVGKSFI